MDSEERRFSGKVYSRRNQKDVSPATAAGVTAPENAEQPAKVTFPMDSEERRFSGKVYSRRNRKTLKKGVSLAIAAGVTTLETKVSETLGAEQPAKVTFPVDSEKRRFSGKVHSRRNRKTLKKGVSLASAAGVTTLETKVSETLDAEQSAKVIPQIDLLITNSTSGDVPEGCVELREGSQPYQSLISRAEDMVRLNKSRSLVEIREARRVLEGELDHVRGMVKKIEAKEKLQHTSRKHRGLVLKSSRPISSYRYPRFTVDDVLKNRCPNFVRPIDLPNPFRSPSLAAIASYGIVEREKRTRKPNRYYNSYDYLLGKDKLPFEINKKSKKNKNETKNKGFALTMNRKDLATPSTCRNARHPIPFVDALRQGRILERGKSITGAAEPSSKRDLTSEEIGKLNRGLENLPAEELGAVAEIIKKRGVTYKQNNEVLELDIESIDAEMLWELDRFVTKYNKSRPEVAVQVRARASQNAPVTSTSGPMIAAALKEGNTSGEMRTSSAHVEGERERRKMLTDHPLASGSDFQACVDAELQV